MPCGRSVQFLVGPARKACRLAQTFLILVEAASFVFFAAAARTGFVAADPANGAAHRRAVGENALSVFSKHVQDGLAGDAGQPFIERAYRGLRLLPLCLRRKVRIRSPDEG